MAATAEARWVRQVVKYDGPATGERILEKLELLEDRGYVPFEILYFTPFHVEIIARRREPNPHAPPPPGPGMDFR